MDGTKKEKHKPFCGILPNLPDETMTPGRMRINTDGKKEAAKHIFSRSGSSLDFRSGLPIGNGDFGAEVHGYPDNYIYNISKNDLWWDDFDSTEPCYPDCGIGGVRKMAQNGDIELKKLIYKSSSRRNSQPVQTSAARLVLHFCMGSVFANVKERLDISTGFASQTFSVGDTNGIINGNNFEISSVISHVDDVMQIACKPSPTAGKFGAVRFELMRDPMEVCANIGVLSKQEIKRREDEIDKYYKPQCFVNGDRYGFNMRLRSGHNPEQSEDFHYTVLMMSSCKSFCVNSVGTSIFAEGRTDEGELYFYLTVVSTYDAKDTLAEANRRLDAINDTFPNVAGGNSYEWYMHNLMRSWIRLPQTQQSQPWYWGLYEAFSARRPGKFVPGYIAPWFASCYGNWGYNILTYEQTKSNLGLLATNRAELLECWFALCKRSRNKLREFTKAFYNMDGVCYPHAISDIGTVIASSNTINGTIMNISTAGETVKYAWDYYEYTCDKDFLREVGYPLLKDVAVFYSSYLLTDENGKKYIFPSRSQEFVSPVGLSNEFMINSIIDLCLFKFILQKAALSAQILGVDSELREKWLNDLENLPQDYATWPDGTWKVSEDCDDRTLNYGVPSVSDLSPVVLSGEVDNWHGNSPEIIETARKSVEAYVPKNALPWDVSFGIIARLRFADREYAKKVLELLPLTREGGNLNRSDACDFNKDNEINPDGRQEFFVDKGSAYLSEVITEMLLQSQGGIIRVFPAYPFELGDAAFYSLRARGAFLVSSEVRNGNIIYAIVRSLKGNDCTFANPFGENVRVRNLENGKTEDYTVNGDNIMFNTKAEYEYVIEDANAVLESFEVLS